MATNKKPARCANTRQAIFKKLQSHITRITGHVKPILIGLSDWLALLLPF